MGRRSRSIKKVVVGSRGSETIAPICWQVARRFGLAEWHCTHPDAFNILVSAPGLGGVFLDSGVLARSTEAHRTAVAALGRTDVRRRLMEATDSEAEMHPGASAETQERCAERRARTRALSALPENLAQIFLQLDRIREVQTLPQVTPRAFWDLNRLCRTDAELSSQNRITAQRTILRTTAHLLRSGGPTQIDTLDVLRELDRPTRATVFDFAGLLARHDLPPHLRGPWCDALVVGGPGHTDPETLREASHLPREALAAWARAAQSMVQALAQWAQNPADAQRAFDALLMLVAMPPDFFDAPMVDEIVPMLGHLRAFEWPFPAETPTLIEFCEHAAELGLPLADAGPSTARLRTEIADHLVHLCRQEHQTVRRLAGRAPEATLDALVKQLEADFATKRVDLRPGETPGPGFRKKVQVDVTWFPDTLRMRRVVQAVAEPLVAGTIASILCTRSPRTLGLLFATMLRAPGFDRGRLDEIARCISDEVRDEKAARQLFATFLNRRYSDVCADLIERILRLWRNQGLCRTMARLCDKVQRQPTHDGPRARAIAASLVCDPPSVRNLVQSEVVWDVQFLTDAVALAQASAAVGQDAFSRITASEAHTWATTRLCRQGPVAFMTALCPQRGVEMLGRKCFEIHLRMVSATTFGWLADATDWTHYARLAARWGHVAGVLRIAPSAKAENQLLSACLSSDAETSARRAAATYVLSTPSVLDRLGREVATVVRAIVSAPRLNAEMSRNIGRWEAQNDRPLLNAYLQAECPGADNAILRCLRDGVDAAWPRAVWSNAPGSERAKTLLVKDLQAGGACHTTGLRPQSVSVDDVVQIIHWTSQSPSRGLEALIAAVARQFDALPDLVRALRPHTAATLLVDAVPKGGSSRTWNVVLRAPTLRACLHRFTDQEFTAALDRSMDDPQAVADLLITLFDLSKDAQLAKAIRLIGELDPRTQRNTEHIWARCLEISGPLALRRQIGAQIRSALLRTVLSTDIHGPHAERLARTFATVALRSSKAEATALIQALVDLCSGRHGPPMLRLLPLLNAVRTLSPAFETQTRLAVI